MDGEGRNLKDAQRPRDSEILIVWVPYMVMKKQDGSQANCMCHM
jgi:hypothetical protein